MGEGLRREPQDAIQALTVWNGSLVAAGSFGENVARWTGSEWQPMPGLPATVYDLVPFGERLVAAGVFHNVNGAPNAIAGWIE